MRARRVLSIIEHSLKIYPCTSRLVILILFFVDLASWFVSLVPYGDRPCTLPFDLVRVNKLHPLFHAMAPWRRGASGLDPNIVKWVTYFGS